MHFLCTSTQTPDRSAVRHARELKFALLALKSSLVSKISIQSEMQNLLVFLPPSCASVHLLQPLCGRYVFSELTIF